MKELFKKIELSKSEGPHFLLLLKHLSPIHHLKQAKEIEEVGIIIYYYYDFSKII